MPCFFNCKSMKNISLILLFIIFNVIISCSKDEIILTNPAHEYFIEIAMRNEIYQRDKDITKWKKDIKIYFAGLNFSEFEEEKLRVIDELNDLIDPINIDVVDTEEEANIICLFGTYSYYVDTYEPIFNDFEFGIVPRGAGYARVNRKGEIESATFFVDIWEISTGKFASIYREELTQILGLPNDTDSYPESIFYQESIFYEEDSLGYVTEYAEIDKEIIQLLYSCEIKPGMNERRVRRVLSRME